MPCPFVEDSKRVGPWEDTRDALLHELKSRGGLHELTLNDLNQLMANITTADKISNYLQSTNEYVHDGSNSHWTSTGALSRDNILVQESGLYEPITQLFNNILTHFRLYNSDTLKVLNVARNDSSHTAVFDATNDSVRFCSPLRAVHFDGRYFKSTKTIETGACVRCATPIDVRVHNSDITEADEDEYLARCAAYARHYLYQQTGRRFVYVPLITNQQVRLYRFDRGGALRSPWVNIHQHPEVLVRIVLFTCGQSGDLLGANPAITWDGGSQYITVAGVTYKVDEELFSIPLIRSRGAGVWRVFDQEGNARVIKHSWRSKRFGRDDSETEWKLLNDLKGVQGVVQIVDHSEDESLWRSRGISPETPFDGSDRLAAFTVLQCYGEGIKKFDSPLQFLEAFRDAIAGHQRAWQHGVLHRDVSEGNLLLGEKGAEDGFRGILIDLDRATPIYFNETLPEANALYGTRAFQSLNVIRSESPREDDEPYHSHTYLDDLQSFLWVFLWIVVGYEVLPNGKSSRIRPKPELLTRFTSMHPFVAEAAKVHCLQSPDDIKPHISYPPQFNILKTQLIKFFAHYTLQQPKTVQSPTPELLSVVSAYHYKKLLSWIDDAISDLKLGITRKAGDMMFDFSSDDLEIAGLQKVRDRADAIESLVWSWITSSATGSSQSLQAAEKDIFHFVTQLEKEPPKPPPALPSIAPPCTPILSPTGTLNHTSYGPSPFVLEESLPVTSQSISATHVASSIPPSDDISTRNFTVFRPMENANGSPSEPADNAMKLKRGHVGEENETQGVKRSKGLFHQ